MDYKAVIEEQIQELQKLQDVFDWTNPDAKIGIASQIASLCTAAQVVDHRDHDYDITRTMAAMTAQKAATAVGECSGEDGQVVKPCGEHCATGQQGY